MRCGEAQVVERMVRRATRRVRFDCELKGLSFALKIWDHVGLFAGENRMAQPLHNFLLCSINYRMNSPSSILNRPTQMSSQLLVDEEIEYLSISNNPTENIETRNSFRSQES